MLFVLSLIGLLSSAFGQQRDSSNNLAYHQELCKALRPLTNSRYNHLDASWLNFKPEDFTDLWSEYLELSGDRIFSTTDPAERLEESRDECRHGRNFTNLKCLYGDVSYIGSLIEEDLKAGQGLVGSSCKSLMPGSREQYQAYLGAWFYHPIINGMCHNPHVPYIHQGMELWTYFETVSHLFKWMNPTHFTNNFYGKPTDRYCAGIFGKSTSKHLREEIDKYCPSSSPIAVCELSAYIDVADTLEKLFQTDIPLTEQHFLAIRMQMYLTVSEIYGLHPDYVIFGSGFNRIHNNIYFNETLVKLWIGNLVDEIYNGVRNQMSSTPTYKFLLDLLPNTFPCRNISSEFGSLDWVLCMFGRMIDPLKSFDKDLSNNNRVQINTDIDYEKFLAYTQQEQILLLSEASQSNLYKVAEDLKKYIEDSIDDSVNSVKSNVEKTVAGNFGKLQSYFQSMATFDKNIAKADIGFIKGQIEKYNKRAASLNSGIINMYSALFWRACTMAALDIAENTIKVALTVANMFNPLKWMGDGTSSIVEAMDAAAELMQAFASAAKLGGINNAWRYLTLKTVSVRSNMGKNTRYLSTTRELVDTLSNDTLPPDFEKKKLYFIEKYNDYTPAVNRDDLTQVSAYYEILLDELCDVIDSFSGTLSGDIKLQINGDNYCIIGKVAVQKWIALFEEMYELQYDLMDALTDCVRASASFHAATSITSGLTQAKDEISQNRDIDVIAELKLLSVISVTMYNVAILIAKENYCNLLEYKEGRRPEVCEAGGTSIAPLLSRSHVKCHSNHGFQNIPTQPSFPGDKAYIDVKDLYAGNVVQFQVPSNQWLVDKGWITEDQKDLPFFVQRFEVYIPVKSSFEKQVRVKAEATVGNHLRRGDHDRSKEYILTPRRQLLFSYREGPTICRTVSIPNPYSSQCRDMPDLCQMSVGVSGDTLQTSVYPSIYALWNIQLFGYELDNLPLPATDMSLKIGLQTCTPVSRSTRSSTTDIEMPKDITGSVYRLRRRRSSLTSEGCCQDNYFVNQSTATCVPCPANSVSKYDNLLCECKPCLNGGVLVVENNQCFCLCALDYFGDLCELRECQVGEYTCDNKKCILGGKFCDKVDNCGDNSDEPAGCVRDSDEDCRRGFICSNKCIPKHWECDGDLDCGGEDLSDEESCGKLNPNKCPAGWFHYAGNCYLISTETTGITAIDAAAVCEGNGELARLSKEGEQTFIFTQLKKGQMLESDDSVWIGEADVSPRFTGRGFKPSNGQCVVLNFGTAGFMFKDCSDLMAGFVCKTVEYTKATGEPVTPDVDQLPNQDLQKSLTEGFQQMNQKFQQMNQKFQQMNQGSQQMAQQMSGGFEKLDKGFERLYDELEKMNTGIESNEEDFKKMIEKQDEALNKLTEVLEKEEDSTKEATKDATESPFGPNLPWNNHWG